MEKEKFCLNADDFAFLEEKMILLGFTKVKPIDQGKNFKRLGLVPPREITGRETTFVYTNHGYTVVVHTTYLEDVCMWRETSTDSGWVLIRQGDKPIYFARPFQRKKSFLLKILKYAFITKWKVDNRPLCKKCGGYMNIHRKVGTRQYFWACYKRTFHPGNEIEFLPWDYGLPKIFTEYLSIRRSYAERYKKKNKKEGIVRTPAPLIRKKWSITKPQNKE